MEASELAGPDAAPQRVRNPRGSGARLRVDIVEAARQLLIEEGFESSVTLRRVAREVGIAAPSIYAHFADADAIVQAVTVETFAEMDAAIAASVEGLTDPEERLLTGCEAYLSFGLQHANLYRLLFDRNRQLGGQRPDGRDVTEGDLQVGAFGRLFDAVQACIDAGVSDASSASLTALELWVAMHGLVSLRGGGYEMPWPDRTTMERSMIRAIARLHPESGTNL